MSRQKADYGFNIRDLRRAIVVAEQGSLRRAALSLQVDQGTLTRSIRALEHGVRVSLFVRTRQGVTPTIEGAVFLNLAASVLDGMDEAVNRLHLCHTGAAGCLRLGMQMPFAAGFVLDLLDRYGAEAPGVALQVTDGTRDRLLRAVLVSRLDAAIVIAGEGWPGASLSLGRERLFAAIASDHALASRAAVTWPGLTAYVLTLSAGGAGMAIRDLALRGGIAPERIALHDAETERLLPLARGRGRVVLVTEGAAGLKPVGIVFRPVMGEQGPSRLDLSLCWQGGESGPVLTRFIEWTRRAQAEGRSAGSGGA